MSSQKINVHYLPRYVTPEELAGSAVVVIDVLRATTTICQALASGATEVIPFQEIDETLAAAERLGRANVVLGGERKGKRIEGFDLGNSPSEYTRGRVAGKRVLITTTNGTRALAHARLAKRVLVGAIVNLSAIVASLQDEPRIDILCAGTDGEETGEDILAAGALVVGIVFKRGGSSHEFVSALSAFNGLSRSANSAGKKWCELLLGSRNSGQDPPLELALQFRHTPGGRNLLEIGLESDLTDCAQIDKLHIAPELDIANGRIRVT
jgi:2-phosphosulfolactate phosphatase